MGECKGERTDISNDHMGTRIGALFVILVTSAIFTIFPILTRRIPNLRIPGVIYDFAKYFGSGVIIATAFVHLLEPATDELGQECLTESFQNYPMAYAFALISMMLMFIGEFFAYRYGSHILESRGMGDFAHNHHQHGMVANAVHTSEQLPQNEVEHHLTNPNEVEHNLANPKEADLESDSFGGEMVLQKNTSGTAEVIGVFVLELGVVFHSVIIGLTLATTEWEGDDDKFYVLFPVIVFHQLFEGLGLGSRLAYMPEFFSMWFLCLLALIYALCTPVGMAIGLGIRNTFSADTPTYYYTTGVFDSVSAGILIYTGLVELMAHDFIFNREMHAAPTWKVLLNIFELCAGVGVMALLGRWA